MADSEDVESKTRENILYDLSFLSEWKIKSEIFTRSNREKQNVSAVGRVASLVRRSAWTFLRTVGISMQSPTPCILPEQLVRLKGSQCSWKLAVSNTGNWVAIAQESCIEIRTQRDNLENVFRRCLCPTDPHPQWRCMAWSEDEAMIACSRSSGAVDIFEISGALVLTIPGASHDDSSPPDLSDAVAALVFTDFKSPDEKWDYELLVINHHGRMVSYYVSRYNNHKIRFTHALAGEYPRGVSSAVYDPRHRLLLVGGTGVLDKTGSLSQARTSGISAWRLLSDAPFCKLVTDYDEDKERAKNAVSIFSKFNMAHIMQWNSDPGDGIFMLCRSPASKLLVTLHFSGKLALWELPSLRLKKEFELQDQPDWDELSPAFEENPTKRKRIKDLIPHKQLLDVNFWSENQLILARCTGAVSVVSCEDLHNMLGKSPEWYEPSPHITQALNGGFLGMECEIRFGNKKMVLGEEDEADDSDEEELALIARAWHISKHTFNHFFIPGFEPPKRKPKHVTKFYRIVSLKSTTPQDLYAKKIDAEEYGEALALAQAYKLDCDLVYQRQWRTSAVSKASIQDYLSKISKRAWVLHECFDSVPENIDAMTELLEYGLHGTDLPALLAVGRGEDGGRFILCDPDEGLYDDIYDEFNPESMRQKERKRAEIRQSYLDQIDFKSLNLEQKEICRARLKFLQYLDRLKTYECILGGPSVAAERYNAKFYTTFRSRSIYELAAEYAQNNDWRAVDTLLTFHSQELAPHRLAILSNFPETADPSDFTSLLPEIGEDDVVIPWETDSWREMDWVEAPGYRKAVDLGCEDESAFLYATVPCKYRSESLTRDIAEDWYSERACEIERRSRLVDFAIELVKQGIQRGAESLGELLDDLVVMEMMVYECSVDDSLTFAKLREMADYDRLELIMSKSSEEMYAKNLWRWVMPFLERCEQRQPGAYDELLRDFVLTKARDDLTDVLKIFQISKTTVPSPMIRTSTELMSLALDALYSCTRDDQLDLIVKIFECLPSHSHDAQGDLSENARLHKQIDHLEQHICAAKIFEANDMKSTLAYIKSSENDPEESRTLMVRLTRMASKRFVLAYTLRSLPLNEMEWLKLHEEVMTLQAKVYRCISRAVCREIFVESLMCSGRQDTIRLAGQMLERSSIDTKPSRGQKGAAALDKVPYARAVELVLSAAREYFDSSASLSDPCMDLSRSCLNLILDAPKPIQEELDLIASLALLNEFGVNVLPLQVRLSKDRLDLVQKAVTVNPTSYKQTPRLLRLGQLLGISCQDDSEREGQIVQMCAEAAVNASDFEIAYQYCARLIALCYSQGWSVCVRLAQQEEFRNIDAKAKLLSFALTYCSNEMIQPILQARALLETQILYEKVNKAVKGDNTSNHVNHQNAKHPGTEQSSHLGSQEESHSTSPDPVPKSTSNSTFRESPFSARAAIKQTQQILSSTKRTTTSVLSTITDHKWWASAVTSLQGLSTTDKTGRQVNKAGEDNRNASFQQQGCHPFYASVMGDCYEDKSQADYSSVPPSLSHQHQVLSLSILRTAKLEELITQGEKQQPVTEALLDLARHTLPRDTTLGLAYLLALPKSCEADVAGRCFEELPSTDISLQVAILYYALRIYSCVASTSGMWTSEPHVNPLYRQAPAKVVGRVKDYLSSIKGKEEAESKIEAGLVDKLQHYQEMLEDYNQACVLQGLGKGVDVIRFAEDQDYKQETIYGLAMSLDEEVYNISLSLAQRYDLPLWDVYMCHLEFLFSDSGLSMEEIQTRVSKLGISPTLKERGSEFTSRMMARVYPTLDGTDLKGLTYFFSLLVESSQDKVLCGLTPAEHAALLKKLKGPCPGMDFKKLMDDSTAPVTVLQPCLTATNVNAVAKLAPQIPDKNGGFLHPSSLYSTWAAQVFWKGEDGKKLKPDSMAGWVHRYEGIGDLIQRLRPEDFISLVDSIVFTPNGRETLDIPCREEITKRALKFSRQGGPGTAGGKKKKQEDSGSLTWEKCRDELQTRLNHLKSLSNDTIQSFAQAEDKVFSSYAERYDLSKGDLTQIELLLVQLILDGHAVELVDDILQVAPPSNLRTHTVVRRAVTLIVAALRGQCEEPGITVSKTWLEVLEMVVENVREHQDNGGDLVKAEDVMSLLRSFCSDASIEVPPRLDVLRVVEKSFELSATDTLLLTLYRTDALVSSTWPQIKVSEEQISTEEARLELFSHLLSESSDPHHYTTLCRILVLWPKLSGDVSSDPDKNPWVSVFQAVLDTQREQAETILDTVLEKECTDYPLDVKCCQHVFDLCCKSSRPRVAVKLVLHSNHLDLYTEALDLLASISEGADNPELIRLILEAKLAPRVVSMPVYPAIVDFILQGQGQEDTPTSAIPQTVASQLAEAGLQAEAGSLLLQAQSSHSLLQTFNSALAAASQWFSTSQK